jgi:hypothetical protein
METPDTAVTYWKLMMVVADLNSVEQSIASAVMKRNSFDFEWIRSSGSSFNHH